VSVFFCTYHFKEVSLSKVAGKAWFAEMLIALFASPQGSLIFIFPANIFDSIAKSAFTVFDCITACMKTLRNVA
jgi:hypothetical protein